MNFSKLMLALAFLFVYQNSFSQAIKKFDYNLLENKTLKIYMKPFKNEKRFEGEKTQFFGFTKMVKLTSEERLKIWQEGVAMSSYDITPYEFTDDENAIRRAIKNKDRKFLLLKFSEDDHRNEYAKILSVYPKRQIIASAVINNFNLTTKEDISLMMNILNSSLEAALELENSGGKKMKDRKALAAKRIKTFVNSMDEMTFLVAKKKFKSESKSNQRNHELQEAMKDWNRGPYEIVDESEIQAKREERAKGYYYLRQIPVWNGTVIVPYMNLLLSTEDDNVLFGFSTTKSSGSSTIKRIDSNISKFEKKHM